MKMFTKLFFLLLACAIGKSAGNFQCYVCGFSSTDIDRSCLEITESTPRRDCRHQYCTIMRQEFIDPSGYVATFLRSCEESPVFLNHDVEDSTYHTYFRACTESLCNIGDGIESVGGSSLSAHPPYNGINLLVPGTGSGTIKQSNFMLLVVTTLFILVICFCK